MTFANPYLFWMRSVSKRQQFVVCSFETESDVYLCTAEGSVSKRQQFVVCSFETESDVHLCTAEGDQARRQK